MEFNVAFMPIIFLICISFDTPHCMQLHSDGVTEDIAVTPKVNICGDAMTRINLRRVRSHESFNITGTWVSSRCEVRPGPEFITRSYSFSYNGSFEIYQQYYVDYACREPSHSILALGHVLLDEAYPVGTRGSATSIKYNISKVLAHSFSKGGKFEALLSHYCRKAPVTAPIPSHTSGNITIIYDGKSKKCMKAINFGLNELELMAIEESLENNGGSITKSLYVGDISTDINTRTKYHPITFQTPLLHTMYHDYRCKVCEAIKRSSFNRPPILPQDDEVEFYLSGTWTSVRCERRMDGFYQIRQFYFNERNSSWAGFYAYYKDAGCSKTILELTGKGRYIAGENYDKIPGSKTFVFRVEKLFVKPKTKYAVSFLKRDELCGRTNKWEINLNTNVSESKGCSSLGIKLPYVEYEILRVAPDSVTQELLLFTGQSKTDGTIASSEEMIPTSFQSELVKCVHNNIKKPKRNNVKSTRNKSKKKRQRDSKFNRGPCNLDNSFKLNRMNSIHLISISLIFIFVLCL